MPPVLAVLLGSGPPCNLLLTGGVSELQSGEVTIMIPDAILAGPHRPGLSHTKKDLMAPGTVLGFRRQRVDLSSCLRLFWGFL